MFGQGLTKLSEGLFKTYLKIFIGSDNYKIYKFRFTKLS